MPRDILSRSGSRPQQQSQPALLPDKKGRQRLLEGGAALGKFDFHAHAAHAKAVRIDGPSHKFCALSSFHSRSASGFQFSA